MRIIFVSIFAIIINTSVAYCKIAAVIGDPITGKIFFEVNKDTKNYPASLTKMMTIYIIFDFLEKKNITFEEKVKFSKYASSQQPSKLNIPQGKSITVEEIIEGLIIKSGNDAAVAIAEKISGSEKKFVKLMNKYAKKLNMINTNFSNPNGLPSRNNLSTAYDMFLLSSSLYNDFPSYRHYFNKTKTTINGVSYKTHNKLVLKYEHYKGIKTGYIRKSGFQISLLGIFDEKPIVGIYFGGNTAKERNDKIHFLMKKIVKENLKNPEIQSSTSNKVNKKYTVQTSSFRDLKKSKIFILSLLKNNKIKDFKHIHHNIEKNGKYFVTKTEKLSFIEAKKFCDKLKSSQLDCFIKGN